MQAMAACQRRECTHGQVLAHVLVAEIHNPVAAEERYAEGRGKLAIGSKMEGAVGRDACVLHAGERGILEVGKVEGAGGDAGGRKTQMDKSTISLARSLRSLHRFPPAGAGRAKAFDRSSASQNHFPLALLPFGACPAPHLCL